MNPPFQIIVFTSSIWSVKRVGGAVRLHASRPKSGALLIQPCAKLQIIYYFFFSDCGGSMESNRCQKYCLHKKLNRRRRCGNVFCDSHDLTFSWIVNEKVMFTNVKNKIAIVFSHSCLFHFLWLRFCFSRTLGFGMILTRRRGEGKGATSLVTRTNASLVCAVFTSLNEGNECTAIIYAGTWWSNNIPFRYLSSY